MTGMGLWNVSNTAVAGVMFLGIPRKLDQPPTRDCWCWQKFHHIHQYYKHIDSLKRSPIIVDHLARIEVKKRMLTPDPHGSDILSMIGSGSIYNAYSRLREIM